jgi:hypothetical protein
MSASTWRSAVADLTRTVYQIELLTDCSPPTSLTGILYEMTDGHASGELTQVNSESVSPLVMGRLLINQRSDPDFLLNADEYEDERLCPDCEERGSPKHDNGQVVLYECHNEDCDREDMWEVPRWRDEDWEEPMTRRIEFLVVHGDTFWSTAIRDVPVEIRWEGLQKYADEKLLWQFPSAIKLIPWNEDTDA